MNNNVPLSSPQIISIVSVVSVVLVQDNRRVCATFDLYFLGVVSSRTYTLGTVSTRSALPVSLVLSQSLVGLHHIYPASTNTIVYLPPQSPARINVSLISCLKMHLRSNFLSGLGVFSTLILANPLKIHISLETGDELIVPNSSDRASVATDSPAEPSYVVVILAQNHAELIS